MKYFFPVLLLLTLCAGCKKADYQYAIVCDFPSLYAERSWLVASDDDGNTLKAFEIPQGTNNLLEKFDYKGEGVPDEYNLHLIVDGGKHSAL